VRKLDDALSGVQRLGFDTAPFIYFVERNPVYLELVREVVRRISSGELTGHTSAITLTEVLVQPLRVGNTALAQRYRRFLSRSRNLVLEPITAGVAEQAAALRARYGLRTPDAVQIAAALGAGCTAFLTNDSKHQRVVEINVLVLDELEL
jgi:predicted nucleic acid-binding protein